MITTDGQIQNLHVAVGLLKALKPENHSCHQPEAMLSLIGLHRSTQRCCSQPVALFLLCIVLPKTFLVGALIVVFCVALCIPLATQWQLKQRLTAEHELLMRCAARTLLPPSTRKGRRAQQQESVRSDKRAHHVSKRHADQRCPTEQIAQVMSATAAIQFWSGMNTELSIHGWGVLKFASTAARVFLLFVLCGGCVFGDVAAAGACALWMFGLHASKAACCRLLYMRASPRNSFCTRIFVTARL